MGPWTVVTPDWDLRPTATAAGRAGGGGGRAGKRLLIFPFWAWLWPPGQAWTPPSTRPMSRRPAAELGGTVASPKDRQR
jgi:hypothetical protein